MRCFVFADEVPEVLLIGRERIVCRYSLATHRLWPGFPDGWNSSKAIVKTPEYDNKTPKYNKIMKEQVLKAMREFGAPVNAGKIAEITGIDRKEVDKAFAELKKEGAIVSPVRCKWEPAK